MNIKWILVLLCLILFIVVNEAKKYEGKGKDVQKNKYDKSQKGKSSETLSKSEKLDKKNKEKNSKSVKSAEKVKTVSDQKGDSKRRKREASKISSDEKPVASTKKLQSKEQKNGKSKNLSKNEKSKNHEKIAESSNSNVKKIIEEPASPAEALAEKSVKIEESKKVVKKQKREINPSDSSKAEIVKDTGDQSFQPAAEEDISLEDNQSKNQAKKEKKKKQNEKTDAQKTPEIDIVSVLEEV